MNISENKTLKLLSKTKILIRIHLISQKKVIIIN